MEVNWLLTFSTKTRLIEISFFFTHDMVFCTFNLRLNWIGPAICAEPVGAIFQAFKVALLALE